MRNAGGGNRSGRRTIRAKINDSAKMGIMLALTVILLCVTGTAVYKLVGARMSAGATRASGTNFVHDDIRDMADGIVTLAQEQGESAARSENSSILVAIDPGHGGYDNGSNINGIYEQDITLDIALYLERELKEMGYGTLLLREDNETHLFPEERVEMAEKADADIFISIHVNTFDSDTSVYGLETWYCKDSRDSRLLAELVQEGTAETAKAKDRGLKETNELIVIRDTTMPSCLVETGFLTNKAERKALVSKEYQEKLAKGMAQGIDEFVRFQNEAKENGKDGSKAPVN